MLFLPPSGPPRPTPRIHHIGLWYDWRGTFHPTAVGDGRLRPISRIHQAQPITDLIMSNPPAARPGDLKPLHPLPQTGETLRRRTLSPPANSMPFCSKPAYPITDSFAGLGERPLELADFLMLAEERSTSTWTETDRSKLPRTQDPSERPANCKQATAFTPTDARPARLRNLHSPTPGAARGFSGYHPAAARNAAFLLQKLRWADGR